MPSKRKCGMQKGHLLCDGEGWVLTKSSRVASIFGEATPYVDIIADDMGSSTSMAAGAHADADAIEEGIVLTARRTHGGGFMMKTVVWMLLLMACVGFFGSSIPHMEHETLPPRSLKGERHENTTEADRPNERKQEGLVDRYIACIANKTADDEKTARSFLPFDLQSKAKCAIAAFDAWMVQSMPWLRRSARDRMNSKRPQEVAPVESEYLFNSTHLEIDSTSGLTFTLASFGTCFVFCACCSLQQGCDCAEFGKFNMDYTDDYNEGWIRRIWQLLNPTPQQLASTEEVIGTDVALYSAMYKKNAQEDARHEAVEQMYRLLRREARFMMLVPLLPLLCFEQTTCEDGVPDFLYMIYGLIMLRSKLIEWRILRACDKKTSRTIFKWLVFSTLEHFDWFTDGIFPLQAYKCDDLMTPAFNKMQPPILGTLMGWPRLHFWGLALITYLSAMMLQQGVAATPSLPGAAADTAAFAAVADLHLKENLDFLSFREEAGITEKQRAEAAEAEASWMGKYAMVFAKVLFENCLQLQFQRIAFAMSFSTTTRWAKCKALASMITALICATVKSASGIMNILSHINPRTACCHPVKCIKTCYNSVYLLLILAFPHLCALTLIGLTCFQLFYTFACPSHLWHAMDGCID